MFGQSDYFVYLCNAIEQLIIKKNNIMKTKREYERPTMKVAELRHRVILMASGDRKATLSVTYDEEDI